MIEAEGLVHRYGDQVALDGVSFSIPAGQICGYLGPNGAGKSTTIQILVGLLRPASGTARIQGASVVEDPLGARTHLGYVPEVAALYQTLTVRETLLLVGDLHDVPEDRLQERIDRLLELFELREAADRLVNALSKGMRQKLLLSTALVHDPEVLLLDEPLSGLDANAARTVKQLLRGLADRGRTILFCSHVLEAVERVCDRVVILHQGRIVLDESASGLRQRFQGETLEDVFHQVTATGDDADVAGALLEAVTGGTLPRLFSP